MSSYKQNTANRAHAALRGILWVTFWYFVLLALSSLPMASAVETSTNLADGEEIFEWMLGLLNTDKITPDMFGTPGLSSAVMRKLVMQAVFAGARENSPKHRLAFFFIVGSTFAAKQVSRMAQVVGPVIETLKVIPEANEIMAILNTPIKSVRMTGQRLSTAFPDMALALYTAYIGPAFKVTLQKVTTAPAAGSTAAPVTTTTVRYNTNDTYYQKVDLFGRATGVTIPRLLCFAQAHQMFLDSDLQMVADNYVRHYWLAIVDSLPEVDDCADFVFKYFETGRRDRYHYFFPADMLSKDATDRQAFLNYFKGEISNDKLLSYHHLMSLFWAGERDITFATLTDVTDSASYKSLVTNITPRSALTAVSQDERRDGKAPKFLSNTPDYATAKKALMRGTSKQSGDNLLLGSSSTKFLTAS